jgi:hypothetical protein
MYACMHRFNSTETTYSFCFFGDITANGSISLGRYQRWGVRTFDHIDHDDSSGHAQESDGGVDDDDEQEEEEEEDRLCVASDLNGTCNTDSLSKRVSSLMSNNSYTASIATTTTTASSSLFTWIGSTSTSDGCELDRIVLQPHQLVQDDPSRPLEQSRLDHTSSEVRVDYNSRPTELDRVARHYTEGYREGCFTTHILSYQHNSTAA